MRFQVAAHLHKHTGYPLITHQEIATSLLERTSHFQMFFLLHYLLEAKGIFLLVCFQFMYVFLHRRLLSIHLCIEVIVHHLLVLGEYLAILAKERVERLQFSIGFLHQLYLRISLRTRHKVIDINIFCRGTNTVDATDALHQPGGIPRRIIVQDAVGTMQVDTFGKHLRCHNHLIVVLPLTIIVGIKVGSYGIFHFISVGSSDRQDLDVAIGGLDG